LYFRSSMFRLTKKKPDFFEQLILRNEIVSYKDREKGLSFLIAFFSEIRPAPGKTRRNAEKNLQRITNILRTEKIVLANVQHAFLSQLINSKLTGAITESGIPLSRGFWQELSNRIKHKLLPPLQDENDFLYTINSVFFKKTDYEWVEAIPKQTWIEFFETISFGYRDTNNNIKKELLHSLRILSYQVAQLGLEKEVLNYLPEEIRNKDTAFILQNYKVHELEVQILDNTAEREISPDLFEFKGIIEDCYGLIEHIRDGYSEKGASLQQTYLLLILSNRLQRMQLIADVLDGDNRFDIGRFADIFTMLVRNEKRKNSIREFLSQGVGYLAYQIAEHKGARGHEYITTTRKDFYRIIRSAMGGGLIISVIAIVKNLIGLLKLAPFPIGFLYSINYSAGFVLIDETRSTLATKQPAFTASAVASSLDEKKYGEPNLDNLAATVAKVSRSQIASFVGNLIVVFPLTYLLAWGYYELFGNKIAEGDAAFKMLKDQHPWRSAALLYAAFTGFFLFASGIIAGYWQNKIRYSNIKERLQKHPLLKMSFSPKRLERWGNYVEKNFGTLMGSIALGFFLGFAGVAGKVFGLPFDIRHITISAGNAAIAVFGLGVQNIPPYFLLAVLGGVLAIGFINFLVSFSLAFFIAVRSRGIHLSQYPRLFKTLWQYLLKHPREFIRPPKTEATPAYRPLADKQTAE
jgi:site-specific recombinase